MLLALHGVRVGRAASCRADGFIGPPIMDTTHITFFCIVCLLVYTYLTQSSLLVSVDSHGFGVGG